MDIKKLKNNLEDLTKGNEFTEDELNHIEKKIKDKIKEQ